MRVREQNLHPVSSPEIITENAEPGAPLRYSATVEVRPTVTAAGYAGLAAERPVHAVTDEDVDRFLDRLARAARHASARSAIDTRHRWETSLRSTTRLASTARWSARATSDWSKSAGVPRTDRARTSAARCSACRRTSRSTYPAEHQNPDLAGKTVHFTATVTALAQRDVPALDEAFAKTHADVDTVEALRDLVRQQLDAAAQRDAAGAVRSSLVTQLVAAHEFDVPQSMIERRAELLADEVLEGLGPRRPPASREAELPHPAAARLAGAGAESGQSFAAARIDCRAGAHRGGRGRPSTRTSTVWRRPRARRASVCARSIRTLARVRDFAADCCRIAHSICSSTVPTLRTSSAHRALLGSPETARLLLGSIATA